MEPDNETHQKFQRNLKAEWKVCTSIGFNPADVEFFYNTLLTLVKKVNTGLYL